MVRPTLFQTVNVAPLIGVLLALFVVVLSTLPQSAASTAVAMSPATPPMCNCRPLEYSVVAIATDGSLTLNGAPVERSALVGALHALRDPPDAFSSYVQVRASQDSRYEEFATVAARLEAAGFRVAVINEDIEPL